MLSGGVLFDVSGGGRGVAGEFGLREVVCDA